MNLALILVIGTFVTGVVWAIDRLFFVRARRSEEEEPALVEWSRAFFPVLLVVLVLRSFVAEPFRIPSASMMPTLLVGDFILVNKFAYGLRLPVLETRVLDLGRPERGEVAVFRYPPEPDKDYIKRVIGLPGDHVVYRDKTLHINGERVDQSVIRQYEPRPVDRQQDRVRPGSVLLEESLDGETYRVLEGPGNGNVGRLDMTAGVVVPDGHYLMMGDNRDNSLDGRHWGFVPESHLRGRAMFVWFSWEAFDAYPEWSRIGNGID